MSFRLPKKAGLWFKHIKGNGNGFELDFDSYYFCLIAGLAKGSKPAAPQSESTEIIQQFPKEYQPNRHLIIALYLNAKLKNMGISLGERTALNELLTKLINPISATGLSDEGMKDLNQYAFGGFQELHEYFPDPPRSLDSFLVEFYRFLNATNTNDE